MKFLLLIWATFFIAKEQVLAQHCPFDFACIIVLKVTACDDTSVVPNLNITLLDSLDNTVMTKKWNARRQSTEALKLWQNPKETTHSGIIDNNNPMAPRTIRFGFAEDNYVLVSGCDLPARKIKVEDIDGELNGGEFETVYVKLTESDIYPLCTNFSHWDVPGSYGFVAHYKPIRAELLRK